MGNASSKKSKRKLSNKKKETGQNPNAEIGIQCALIIPANRQDFLHLKGGQSSKKTQVDIKPWLESRSTSITPLKSHHNYPISPNEGVYQASISNINHKDSSQAYARKKTDAIPELCPLTTEYLKNFDLTRVRQAPSKWIHPAPHMDVFSATQNHNFIWQAPSGPVGNVEKSSKIIFLRKAKSWHDYLNQNKNCDGKR
ncbi:unnamed protein product [Rodentolepis nana]|uniref:Uncharacterized protein n=1 Tax=Rodentolepis nana TaxID=102285 RepID=A0A0R3U011_RODNA|nr:unnamed protein product [Rodentolepis nana]